MKGYVSQSLEKTLKSDQFTGDRPEDIVFIMA